MESVHRSRYYKGYLDFFGTSQLHYRSPFVVAWWSAAFPGFGHMLLNQQLKAIMLLVGEIFINVNANINESMVLTFCGNFDRAKDVLNLSLAMIYIPFYLFCIWDSYRTTIDLNKLFCLSRDKPVFVPAMQTNTLDINFLDKRTPWTAFIWSFFLPGLGQIYNRRMLPAFFLIIWSLAITYFSRDLEALHYLIQGDLDLSKQTLDMEWFLFYPSIVLGAAYDTYGSTVEHNKLFDAEQSTYLQTEWQPADFQIHWK